VAAKRKIRDLAGNRTPAVQLFSIPDSRSTVKSLVNLQSSQAKRTNHLCISATHCAVKLRLLRTAT